MNNAIELINKLKYSSIIQWICFYLNILIVSNSLKTKLLIEDFITPKGIDVLVKAFLLQVLLLYIVSALIWMAFVSLGGKMLQKKLPKNDYDSAATKLYLSLKQMSEYVVEEHQSLAKYFVSMITSFKNTAAFYICISIQLCIIFNSTLYWIMLVTIMILSFLFSIVAVFLQKLREHYTLTLPPSNIPNTETGATT